MLRRTLLGAAPAVLLARTRRPWKEVERMLQGGDVRGRLSVDDLPTPALVVDLDALEANIAKMAAHCREKKKALRPHGKTHKCPEIAKRLMAAGAVGSCAAKLGEAEAFAKNGVGGLLVTTAVIGEHKIERATRLARLRPETIYCVDHARNAEDFNDAARAAGLKVNLAVDLYVGVRTGIQTGRPAVELAQAVSKMGNARFAGLQAYAGHASHRNGFEARRAMSREIMQGAVFTWGGDEHGKLNLAKASRGLKVGDRVEFVIPHCDPTVNLHDRMYGVRGNQVETSWAVAARGMGQ